MSYKYVFKICNEVTKVHLKLALIISGMMKALELKHIAQETQLHDD